MGLDMFLTARRSFSTYRGDVAPVVKEVPEGFTVQSISVQAAYWRKANAIHAWFVKHVQGGKDECQASDVSAEQLTTLRDLCAKLLASRSEVDALAELRPQSGFFFGSTDVDNGYWDDLQDTVDQIDKAMAGMPPYRKGDQRPEACWEYIYQSSW